jgi:superfamily II DNA or RNA helicase
VNLTDNELKNSSMRLLPHQIALVEAVFNPASKRVILLRGDVGLGKSATLVAVASRVLRERPTARVLLLAPAALQVQFVEMLRDAGAPALSVDRYQFREMLDSAPGKELWPAGVVAVLSREFARQADIRDALATVRWDLSIVDEAHQLRGPSRRMSYDRSENRRTESFSLRFRTWNCPTLFPKTALRLWSGGVNKSSITTAGCSK